MSKQRYQTTPINWQSFGNEDAVQLQINSPATAGKATIYSNDTPRGFRYDMSITAAESGAGAESGEALVLE